MVIILVGFLAGILSGMGVGGGMVLIPALTIFEGVGQHTAQTVNLFYFIPTAAAALFVHIKNKNVELKKAVTIVGAGLVFSLFGAYLAVRLSANILGRVFAVFVIAAGIREITAGMKDKKPRNS